jgi:hypothetical protein
VAPQLAEVQAHAEDLTPVEAQEKAIYLDKRLNPPQALR